MSPKPSLPPAIKKACDTIFDVISVQTEDVHESSFLLHAVTLYFGELFERAKQAAIKDIDHLIGKSREERRRQAAAQRIADAQKVDPGPAKLEIVGLPE